MTPQTPAPVGGTKETLNIFLDPDFRRNPSMDGSPYCERCQKPILDTRKAIAVTLDRDGLHVIRLGGSSWIGLDCWRKITKESFSPLISAQARD